MGKQIWPFFFLLLTILFKVIKIFTSSTSMLDLTSLHPFVSLSNSCSSYFYILVQVFIYSVSLSFCHFLTHFFMPYVLFLFLFVVDNLWLSHGSSCPASLSALFQSCLFITLWHCVFMLITVKSRDLQLGWTWLLSAGLFVFCRLGLARCSAAHWCGLWGVQTSFPSPCWGGPHPLFWLSTRIQHCRKVPVKWSGTQMQSEKETWVCEGQTGRAHTP